MALKSTVFKAELQIADMDRGHYGTHAVTLARHPSENDERLMVRLLAYALHASDDEPALAFANGMTEIEAAADKHGQQQVAPLSQSSLRHLSSNQ